METRENNSDLEGRQEKYFESNAGDGSKATDQHLKGIKLALTLGSCVATLFIAALDQTIISTILEVVGNKFGSFEKINWLSSAYMLAMATLVPSYGKLSIAFGRKYTILTGIVIFEIGSLVAALAQSMDMLIGGRVIQGVGGGLIQAIVMVIITESVPINKRPLAFVLIGTTWSLASVLGPFVGGAFTTHVTWRWCFYVNLPIGGLAFVLMIFSFNPPKPEGNLREKLKKVDYIGTFLVALGLVLLLLALSFGGIQYPWKSAAVICLFIIGGILLILFLVYNFTLSNDPLIMKEFIKIPQILAACMSSTFNFAFFISSTVYLAIFFQVVFNASAWQSGIDMLPFVITVSVASTINGVFIRFFRHIKLTMMISAVLGPVGTGLLLVLGPSSLVGARIGLLIPIGVSVGLQFQSALLAAQVEAPNDIDGSIILVTTFIDFCRSTASTISVTISQLLLQTTGTTYINQTLEKLPKDSKEYHILKKFPSKSLIESPEIIHKFPPSLRKMIIADVSKALKNVFYWGLALAIVSFFFSIFTTNKKIPKDKDVKTKQDEEEEQEQEQEQERDKNLQQESSKSTDSKLEQGLKD